MAYTIHGKRKLLARVRRIIGQTRALEQAPEEGGECAAVLWQIAAICGAVNGLMNEVLEGHIREHLGAEQASAEQCREGLELVVTVLRPYLKQSRAGRCLAWKGRGTRLSRLFTSPQCRGC